MEATALEQKWAEEAQAEAAREAAQKAAEEAAKAEHVEQAQSLRDHLPKPTGWRIVVLPYRGAQKTKGGIELAKETMERQQLTTTCAYVLAVGPLAYKDTDKFPDGPWCKEGDFVLTRTYSGTRFKVFGKEFRLLNDDQIEGTVADPRGINRAY